MMAALAALVSCDKLLQEESKTSITANWLKTTPEGLDKMVIALYERDRDRVRDFGGEGTFFQVMQLDCCTDIMLFHSGSAAQYARLSGATPSSEYFKQFWAHY